VEKPMERYAKKQKIPAPEYRPNRKNVLNKILWLTGKNTGNSDAVWTSFGTDKKAWIPMYKKHKIKKIKVMRFADPKLFNAPNILGISERYLKIRIIEAIRKKTSRHADMMG
jgi:hypothetical protein